MPIFYETHLLEGADFPYIFHSDTLIRTRRNDSANWHANMEILSITEGSGQCICDAKSYDVLPGDLVIIGSNVIHSAISEDHLRYDCLIVDRGFCKEIQKKRHLRKTDHKPVKGREGCREKETRF